MTQIVLEPIRDRHHHDDLEHRIQCDCVRWFRLQYPAIASLLFAVPNGGSRNRAEAGRMKMEGVTAGVADLILAIPNHEHHMLFIEMKTPKGVQSQTQKEWQRAVEAVGAEYVICRSLEEFMLKVNHYLDDRYGKSK